MLSKKGFFSLGMILATGFVHAGTVIDTNLSSGTVAIVNIDATADGANGWTGNQDAWTDPFNSNGHPLEVTLGPGTYTFSLVNPAAALALNPHLTSSQVSQIYTAWTYNSPWITDYFVWDSSALQNPHTQDLFAGAVSGNIPNYYSYAGASSSGFDNATDAYNAAITSGIGSKIWLGGRFSGTEASSYTLTKQETLVFAIPDYGVYDNAGGDSIAIQTTPEPAGFLAVIPAVGLILRRRRSLNK